MEHQRTILETLGERRRTPPVPLIRSAAPPRPLQRRRTHQFPGVPPFQRTGLLTAPCPGNRLRRGLHGNTRLQLREIRHRCPHGIHPPGPDIPGRHIEQTPEKIEIRVNQQSRMVQTAPGGLPKSAPGDLSPPPAGIEQQITPLIAEHRKSQPPQSRRGTIEIFILSG